MKHISLIILFLCLLAVTGWSQTTFTFTLDEPCKTSAGVYQTNGTLVRTLWNKARYVSAGTYTSNWDGLDDGGNAVATNVPYMIKVLQHNTEYVWDGAIGNTSIGRSGVGPAGPTVHNTAYPISSMTITGTNAFYVSGYNEGRFDMFYFSTANPQVVLNRWGANGSVANAYDRAWSFTCCDSNWVYFAPPSSIPPTNGYAPATNMGFVVASYVTNQATAYFTNGVLITNGPVGNGGLVYPNGIYVGTQQGLSGLAVQQTSNLLAVSVAPDNEVYLLDKRTGATLNSITVTNPTGLAFAPDNSLWVIANSNSVIQFANVNASPAQATVMSGFSDAQAVAVCPTNANIILVADAGSSMQVKAFNSSGSSLWTYGLAGGYQTNGVAVQTNKFWFAGTQTYLCFEPDGSFWVGDNGNFRNLHFDVNHNYIEQIMLQPYTYLTSFDGNNPSRVFDEFLEFSVDYSKPLATSWKLVNNWRVNVPANNIYPYSPGLASVETLTNGRTYALIVDIEANAAERDYEVCELVPTNGLRMTGLFPLGEYTNSSYQTIDLGPDGSARSVNIQGGGFWQIAPLLGFDATNNPIWATSNFTALASASTGSTDPVPRPGGNGQLRVSISTNNVLISNDNSINNGYHLGGILVGTTNWLWKTWPVGTLNGMGNYDISNGVNYAGDVATVAGRNIVAGYHGEFWRDAEASQHFHYYDDGLFVGEFGADNVGLSPYEKPKAGEQGNSICDGILTTNGNYYVWACDEEANAPARWNLVNARNIREIIGTGAFGSSFTLTNPAATFPVGLVGTNGNASVTLAWNPVSGASSYNIYYSTNNGGPYLTESGGSSTANYTATGLQNGLPYYFVVSAIISGVEGMKSEQLPLYPFDTSQSVFASGQIYSYISSTLRDAIYVSSTAQTIGQPSWTGMQTPVCSLNPREIDYYGLGNLENESIGTKGYFIDGWGSSATNLANYNTNFTVTVGSGWTTVNPVFMGYTLDGTPFTYNNALSANPTGTISIGVGDASWHYVTVVSPNEFAYPRIFTLTLTAMDGSSAAYSVNEPLDGSGMMHVFQFKFKGNVTLTASGTGAFVQALFLDDATVTFATNNAVVNVGMTNAGVAATSTSVAIGSFIATNQLQLSGLTNIQQPYILSLDSTLTNVCYFPNPFRTYSTNVTLRAATSLTICFWPPFDDTNYTVTTPNDLVGSTVTAWTTTNFTLGFSSATLIGQTIEGACIQQWDNATMMVVTNNAPVNVGVTNTGVATTTSSNNVTIGNNMATNQLQFFNLTNTQQPYILSLDSTLTNVLYFPNPFRTYSTNVTLTAATSLTINFWPSFADTNYIVTAPNALVGSMVTAWTTTNFTLGFSSATLTGQTIEGACIHLWEDALATVITNNIVIIATNTTCPATNPVVPILATDFETDPLTQGWTINGSGTASWTTNEAFSGTHSIAASNSVSWLSPMLITTPLQWYRLSFKSLAPGPVNPADNPGSIGYAYWAAQFYDTNGNLLSEDQYSSIFQSSGWVTNEVRIRAKNTAGTNGTLVAAQMQIRFEAFTAPLYIDDVQVKTTTPEEVAHWGDAYYTNLPARLAYMPKPDHGSRLPLTFNRLRTGQTLRIVMLGDSVQQDTANAPFDAWLQRQYPGATIQVISSTVHNTGVQNYMTNMQQYVFAYQPDLLVIGGISNDDNMTNFQSVVDQMRAYDSVNGRTTEILILTPQWSPNNNQGNYFLAPDIMELDQVAANNPGGLPEGIRGDLIAFCDSNNIECLDLTGVQSEFIYGPAAAAGVGPPADANGDPYSFWMRDFVHTSDNGNMILGRMLEAFFAPSQ